MSRVEEMIAVRAAAPQALRALLTVARFREWQAPDATMVPLTAAPVLSVGDRFRLAIVGGLGFEYLVEAVSDREVVLAFDGPWRGHERWSFVPDGAETLVRRVYEVDDRTPLEWLAWRTLGAALVAVHYKLELPRFRDAVERAPGPRAEIESSAGARVESRAVREEIAAPDGRAPDPGAPAEPPPPSAPRDDEDTLPFPVDDG